MEENPQEPENQPLEIEPKRGRGRPKGSVDKAPRKRTKIIEEAVEPPPPPPPPVAPVEPVRIKVRRATPAPTHVPVQAPTPASPLSPRTVFKQAGETIHQLQTQREHSRRDYWAEQISKSFR